MKRTLKNWLATATTVLVVLAPPISAEANAHQANVPDWENPAVIGINKEPGHAYMRPYADPGKASEGGASSRIQSLNGKWKFHWVGHPDKRPANFYDPAYDISDWNLVDVPGNWQTQGYGRPIYTNHPYPFAKDQPRVMTGPPEHYTNYYDRNPVGSYKHRFAVEEGLQDKEIFIEFEGVKSAFYLWVNGTKVGYSQGSMTPAEFNITDYLVDGENDLAVEVYRWSDGSYLEGQDMWRFSGIFRDVNLVARPKVYLQDFLLDTALKNNYQSGTLNINYLLGAAQQGEIGQGAQLQVELFAPDNKLLATAHSETGSERSGRITFDLDSVDLWSAELPTLYSLLLSVLDEQGEVLEVMPWSFGFRETKVEDSQFWVNGRSIKIKGVNRHEHHPRMGRHVDLATMEKDIQLIKQGNFNLVRTSHYPNDHRWYELANKYGLYVLDDANQESHGYKTRNKILGDNPSWEKAHVDRATSMVHTNKNYTSVVIWSLGNEGGAGANFRAMRKAVLAIDRSRPILSDTDVSVSDFLERSYRTVESVQEQLEKARTLGKPYIQREFAHAMGNSLGNFQEHWDTIYANDDYVGGAIWDWVDQGLARVKNTAMVSYGEQPQGLSINPQREVWAYGGDFGDKPTDAEFLLNGIVSPDRKPYPSYFEAKKVQQNVWFAQAGDPLSIEVSNRFGFTNLNAYQLRWQVKDQRRVLDSGEFSLNVAPGESGLFDIPYVHEGRSEGEVLLELSAHTRRASLWAEPGFEIAYEQFVLSAFPYATGLQPAGRKVRLQERSYEYTISAGDTRLVIDRQSGELTSFRFDGRELLVQPLAPYFWKPVNNNQSKNRFVERMAPWMNAAAYRQVHSVTAKELQNDLLQVTVDARLPANNARYTTVYTVNGEGELLVDARYQPDPERTQHKFMPKFGVKLALDRSLSNIDWYGRGPFENYPDRKTAARIGQYSETLDSFQVGYISATDSSNRSDVRSARFSDRDTVVEITGLQPFNFRAWPYEESDLYSFNDPKDKFSESARIRRKHYYDLPQRNAITVNLDLEIHGVGGDNSWGGKTMEKYHVRADRPHRFRFIIKAGDA